MSDYYFNIMTKEEMDRQPILKFEILEWNFAETGHSIKIAHNNRFTGLWNFQNGYLSGSWEIRWHSLLRDKSLKEMSAQTLSPMVSELYDWIQEYIRQNIAASTNKK